jgi:hypothetical protein
LDLGVELLKAIEHLKPVESWHPDIEQDEIGIGLGNPWQDLATGFRLTHDFDFGMRFQRKAERLQNEPVVVCNEHPN